MGMPSVNVSFTEKALTAIQRGERGIVALILQDIIAEKEKNLFTILSAQDIPEWLQEENKEQIRLALIGYVNAPKKIIVYVTNGEEGLVEALKILESIRFDYLVVPNLENKVNIVSWIKKQRNNGKMCKAVLAKQSADTEGIINFATEKVMTGDKEFTADQYCSRIAGLIAGTPLTIACTYAALPELTDCAKMEKVERDAAVEAGKFILFWDGEKVKVGRGVNSLVTTSNTKGEQFKKIKIVEAMDMIHDDIIKTAEDTYLGKYENSYDNKCLLISAIDGYFKQLIRDGILETAAVGIDVHANQQYLQSKEIDTSELSEEELKTANTGDQVFLKATIKILDAIEEIELPISI